MFESLLVERSSDTLNPLSARTISAAVKSGDREGQVMSSDTITDGSEEVVLRWAHRCGAPHSNNGTLKDYYSGYCPSPEADLTYDTLRKDESILLIMHREILGTYCFWVSWIDLMSVVGLGD